MTSRGECESNFPLLKFIPMPVHFIPAMHTHVAMSLAMLEYVAHVLIVIFNVTLVILSTLNRAMYNKLLEDYCVNTVSCLICA